MIFFSLFIHLKNTPKTISREKNKIIIDKKILKDFEKLVIYAHSYSLIN